MTDLLTLELRCCWHLYPWNDAIRDGDARMDLSDWVRHEGRKLCHRDESGYLIWNNTDREVRAERKALLLHRFVLNAKEGGWNERKMAVEACRHLAPWPKRTPEPSSSEEWATEYGAKAYAINQTWDSGHYGIPTMTRQAASKEMPGGGVYRPPACPTIHFSPEDARAVAMNELRRLLGFLRSEMDARGGDPHEQQGRQQEGQGQAEGRQVRRPEVLTG